MSKKITVKDEFLQKHTLSPGDDLTTNQGLKISDDQNSLKAGERGPTLLEDFHFREKITHFDHERIPERVVHARGAAAHGYFEAYESAEASRKLRSLPKRANGRRHLFASARSSARAAARIPPATCADSQ